MKSLSSLMISGCFFVGMFIVSPSSILAQGGFTESTPLPQSAPLESAQLLNEENIRAFYAKSAEIQKSGWEQVIEFYKNHISEQAQTTINIVSHFPGEQTQKETVKMTKKQLILKTKESSRVTRIDDLNTKVISIKIEESGKRAFVKDSSFSQSTIKANNGVSVTMLVAEQGMLCDDEIVLTSQNTIQLKTSTCNAEIFFKPQ